MTWLKELMRQYSCIEAITITAHIDSPEMIAVVRYNSSVTTADSFYIAHALMEKGLSYVG